MKPPPPAGGPRVALFGECMLELRGAAFGAMTQGYGGDTLNTAVYLARVAGPRVAVQYATALGDDGLSAGLVERWTAQGVGVDLVRRLPGRLPGLYLIEVDPHGERRFSYWRDQAAARAYFDTDAATPLEAALRPADWLYFSGISLAILPPAGRARLFALAERLRAAGGRVVFDNNFRPRLWPDAGAARAAYASAFACSDIGLLSLDDHRDWLGFTGGTAVDEAAALAHAAALTVPELVVKRGAAATLWRLRSAATGASTAWQAVPTEPVARVVDTTAAGDAFAGAYLARRVRGAPPADCVVAGNRLGARVVQHPGAVIPAEAMADLIDGARAPADRPADDADPDLEP